MSDTIQSRLARLGISIPQATSPVANYVSAVKSGNQLFISGQLPFENGTLAATGKAGADVTADEAKRAAEICALNVLAQAQEYLGNLAKIRKITKIAVFVATVPSFTDIPQIANGASDLFVKLLGEAAGKHTRSAIGVAALPMNATVEVDAVLEI